MKGDPAKGSLAEKLLDTLKYQDFSLLHELLQPAMSNARRTGCGKQLASIEKKMDRFARRNWTGYSAAPPIAHEVHQPTAPGYGSPFGSDSTPHPQPGMLGEKRPSLGDAVEGAGV